jgi:hypothetical protein
MKTRIARNYVPSRREQLLTLISDSRSFFWRKLGSLFKKDFINNPALRKRISAQLVLVLFASTLVAVFVQAPTSNAVVVQDCSAIGQLRNGGFEAPVAGTTVISSAGATYPAETLTAAQQNSSNSVTNAVYGSVGGSFWNHLDASVDGSTYRTFRLPGRAGDARIYWNTTEASEQLELTSFVTPQAGSRFAELNASVQAALYQDIPTIPGVTIRWSLAHRGRSGTDTMRVYIGKPTNTSATVRGSSSRFNASADAGNTTLQNNSVTRTNSARAGLALASARAAGSATLETDISDGTTWRFWYGTYEETSTTTTNTRFMFESVSPTGGSGNLLDSITFAPVAACPITRLYNSPTDTQTVNIFDTNAGSFAIVPDESGHQESVTALTYVEGPGRATLNAGGRSLTFTPNGSGVTTYDYTIRYVANGIASTSDGRITITARDIFGQASCDPGSVETQTATVGGQITVIETFKTPVQANTDADADHRSATCTWTAPEGVFAVDYLVVGGGGGGASGGGGGGGVVTSWSTALGTNTGSERTALRNPLAVTPGEVVNITVGGGGKPGWGGSYRCTFALSTNNACTQPTRTSTNGADSRFGSVIAAGGGLAGGSGQAAGGSGGSGGGSRFDDEAQSGAAVASQVVGASSFGNIGGGSTATGGYRAGGGGGGAGTNVTVSSPPSDGNGGRGGLVRIIDYPGNPPANGRGQIVNQTGGSSGGGGHGGRGVMSNIASTNGTFAEYGCGGGGGLNNNANNIIPGGGGTPGCDTAGRGSNWATFLTTTNNSMPSFNGTCFQNDGTTALANCSNNRITSVQFDGTAVPTEGFGGGGAGTDPEGAQAGSGGSGVVVIRYVVSNIACPNSSNATNVAGPIACPYPITITAGAAVATQYNLSHGTADLGFVSFPGASTDTVTVTSTIGNGTDTVTATVSGNLASFAVSNANTALAGATYPLRYTIFSDSLTSTSFVLLRIVDPSQATPVIIPVDPRVTEIDLPALRIGGSQMTQVCFTPIDDNETSGYSNIPSVDRTTNRTTETRTVTAAIGRLRLQGTSANLQQAVQFIRVTKHASDDLLIPGSVPRRIRVNVSNGTVGGNGSCTFGNESIIELRPMLPEQTIRQGEVKLKNLP